VQEAWITSWKKPPAAYRPLRPWLGQVLLEYGTARAASAGDEALLEPIFGRAERGQ
jgi:hypothetical protein